MAYAQPALFRRRIRSETSTPLAEATDRALLQQFVTAHDEAAFETLVRRHGPMVLGLCRRLLGDAHSAEDAFQATFLVLVRRAGSIQRPELLGNWLYGVACRIAGKARQSAARRSASEKEVVYLPRSESAPEMDRWELRSVLDEEMRQLPEKYRVPLILCYLEGKTNEEAARQLGWPTGSMSWRLARGKELLRQRLLRRNLALTPALLPPFLVQPAGALVSSTAQAGTAFAAGKGAAGAGVSSSVIQMAEETLQDLVVKKIKAWVAVILAMLLALLAGTVVYGAFAGPHRSPCTNHSSE